MLGYVSEVVRRIEADPSVATRDAAFARLRVLGLDDFGEVLLNMPSPDYPRLSRLLPAMASDDVQDNWTGNHGLVLLRQSCAFVRSLAYNYQRLTGRPIARAQILDYGCGYGRLARLMYYFVGTGAVVGVDPLEQSIEQCRKAGLGASFLRSDFLPRRLPTTRKFDASFAFSVFTHTSKRATVTALEAIRASMASDGLLCLTIRPAEYWDAPELDLPETCRSALKEAHARDGYAFFPHDRTPVDGDVTYGDTSMTLAWLAANAIGWRYLGVDRSLDDPYQILVYLKKQGALERTLRGALDRLGGRRAARK